MTTRNLNETQDESTHVVPDTVFHFNYTPIYKSESKTLISKAIGQFLTHKKFLSNLGPVATSGRKI